MKGNNYAFNVVLSALLCCCLCAGLIAGTASPVAAAAVSTEAVVLPAEGSTSPTEQTTVPVATAPVGSTAPVALADADVEFDGLAYMDVTCDLGNIRLYFPLGVSADSLQLTNDKLYNVTSSTLYLFCPDYPEYTFSASRFDTVYYRLGGNYGSVELTEVEINTSSDTLDGSFDYIVVFCLIFIALMLVWRGKK